MSFWLRRSADRYDVILVKEVSEGSDAFFCK